MSKESSRKTPTKPKSPGKSSLTAPELDVLELPITAVKEQTSRAKADYRDLDLPFTELRKMYDHLRKELGIEMKRNQSLNQKREQTLREISALRGYDEQL